MNSTILELSQFPENIPAKHPNSQVENPQEGMIADMRRRDVRYLHCFSVDNAIGKVNHSKRGLESAVSLLTHYQVADPTFIGYCAEQGAELGNKVVWKAMPGRCAHLTLIACNADRGDTKHSLNAHV